MSDYITEVKESDFEKVVLQSETPVLVDFWAEWCRPCAVLAPVVESVAERHAKRARVVKLNVDDNPAIAQQYRVQGIPTLILFQDGEEKERIVGVAGEEAVSQMIDKAVSGHA